VKTTLQAPVELLRVSAFAEIAVFQRRPELQRLCAAAEEGALTDGALDAALPGLSAAARRNLLRHCNDLGLCDEGGILTDGGRRCARTGDTPVREQGVYGFLVARHEAFGTLLLDVTREQPDRHDRRVDDLAPVDELLAPGETVWQTALAPRRSFVLLDLPSSRNERPLGRVAPVHAPCCVRWDLDLATGENRRWLEGTVDDVFRVALPSLDEDVVRGLLAAWDPRFRPALGRVAMAYDGYADTRKGHDPFLRRFRYPDVELPGQATFGEVAIDDIPVGPADAAAAREWALARLKAHLLATNAYVAEAEVRRAFDALVEDTPLADYAPEAPSTDDLLHDLAGVNRPDAVSAWWRVAAPADLEWQR
jgi:hypothetical protein